MNCPQCGFNPFTLAPPVKCVTDRTPRLDALFASNEPPLDTDAPMLQQKLAEARAEATNLDICIAAARAALEGLLAQKATVDGYADQIQAISHPVRTLPTDVLGDIFSSFVDDVMYAAFDDVCSGSFVDSLDIRNGPCVLTHVSSGWRRNALYLPRLWTRIQLKIDRYDEHASASFLQNILSRSLNLPLHITLYDSYYTISDYEKLSVLLGTSDRWQSAAMALPSITFLALNSRITLDALQTVWIHQRFSDPVLQNQIRFLEHAPHLQSIVVNNVSEFLRAFTVPWSQITQFTGIRTSSLNSFCTLFSKAVNLRHASFPEEFHPQIDSGHDVQKSMSNITHLEVASSKVASILLKNIDFPRLEVLHFTHLHFDCPDALRSATSSAIRELSVHATYSYSDSLFAFLCTVPCLGILELHAAGNIGLHCLTVLRLKPELIPRLHTLRLRGPQGVQVTKTLVEMIKARRSSCSAGEPMLRRIVLDRSAQLEAICPDAVQGFEELVGQGLEVQWCWGGS